MSIWRISNIKKKRRNIRLQKASREAIIRRRSCQMRSRASLIPYWISKINRAHFWTPSRTKVASAKKTQRMRTVTSTCQYASSSTSIICAKINFASRTLCQSYWKTKGKSHRSQRTHFSRTSSIPNCTQTNRFREFWRTGHKQPTPLTRASKTANRTATWKIISWMNDYFRNTSCRAIQSK